MQSHRQRSGFTLVELLVVLSIVGVLIKIAIPQYISFLIKARKAEAYHSLSGLRVAESAFFSEYNAYGSALNKIGFSVSNKFYLVGFPTDHCDDIGVAHPPAISCPQLYQRLPGYYQGEIKNTTGKIVNNPLSQCYSGTSWAAPGTLSPPKVGVSPTGLTYVASATGPIAPGTNEQTKVTAYSCSSATPGTQSSLVVDSSGEITEVQEASSDAPAAHCQN